MEEDLKKLYESISTKFDVGSFDDFSAKMETEEMRKSFYDTVSGKGIDLGDYEEYESRLKKKDSSLSQDAALVAKDTQSPSDQSRSSSESLDASIQARGLTEAPTQEDDYRLQAAPQFEAQGVDINEYLSLVDRRGEIEEEMAKESEEKPRVNPYAKTESLFKASLKTDKQVSLESELRDINSSLSKNQESYDKAITNYQDDRFKELQKTSRTNEEFRSAVEAEDIDLANVRLPEVMIDGKSVNLKEWNSWWLNQDNVDLAQDVDKAKREGTLPEDFTPPITDETIEFLKNSENPGLQDAYNIAQRQMESGGQWGDLFDNLHGGLYNTVAFVSQTLGKLESFVMSPIGDYSNYDKFLEEGSEVAMELSSKAEDILDKTRAYEGGITESFLSGDISSALFQSGNGLFQTAPTLAAIAASGPGGLAFAGVSAYGGKDLDITKRNAAIRRGEAEGELIEGWRREVSPIVSAAAEVVGEVATLGILNKARAAGGFSKITDPDVILDSWMKGSAKAFGIEGASESFTEFMDYAVGDVGVLGEEFDGYTLATRMGDAFAIGSLMGPTMYSGTRALYSLKNMRAGDKATTITITRDGKDQDMTRAEYLKFQADNLEAIKNREIKVKLNTSSEGLEFFKNAIYNAKVEEAVEAKAVMREKEKAVSEILEKINSSEDVSTEDINALGDAVSDMKAEEKNSEFNRDKGTEEIERDLQATLSKKNIQILDPVNTQDKTGAKIGNTEKATEITSVEEYNSVLKQLKDGSKRPTIVKGQDKVGIIQDGKTVQESNVDIARFSSVKAAMNSLAEFKGKMEATKNNAVENPETYTKNNRVFNQIKKESLDEVSKETIDNGDYHIISTGLKGLSKDNIDSRDSKLVEDVEALGGKAYKTTTIKDGVEQSSFIIEGLSDAQAMDIANGFQQESIISGKSGKLYSDGTSQEIVGKTYKGLKARSRGESTVVNINGRKTSIANAFSSRTVGGKTIDASNVHQLDESSDNYDSAFMESLTEQQREYLGFMTKLMNSIGNLKFTLLSNNDAARRQLEMLGGPTKRGDIGSFVDPKTGEIFLNLETMRGNTLFHEIMHPFVRFAKKNDPELYLKIKNQVISSRLKKKYTQGRKQVRESYYKWAEKSYENMTVDMTPEEKQDYLVEEAFAEMVGDASWGTFKSQQKPFNQLKAVLRALLRRVFGRNFARSPESVNLKDMSLNSSLLGTKPGMTETLAGALTQGREIKIGDSTFNVEAGEGDLKFQRDAIDRRTQVQYTYDVNSEKFAEMQQDGTINSGASIKDFEGKTMMVHSPDATFSGNLIDRDGTILIEGKGGLYYTMKFNEEGNFWASTDNAANKMVKQLNSMMDANDGKIFMGLTTAPADKLMSNTAISRGIMNLFTSQNFINKIALSKPRVYKALIDAANSKSPTGDGLDLNLKPYRARRKFEESVIEDIWSKLDNSESNFQDRKFFTDKFLTNVRDALVSSRSKTNFVNFIKTTMAEESIVRFNKDGSPNIQSMKKALLNVLTEPELRGEETSGKMYAVLEIEGPVKALKSDAYESYGTAIVSENGNRAKIHRLDTREFWYNFTEEPGTNIVIGDRETISSSGKMSPLKDQIMPMQAGVTMEPVRVTTDIKFQTPQVEEVQWQKSRIGRGDLAITNRREEVREAAQSYFDREINQEEYLDIVKKNSPIKPITQFIDPASLEDIKTAVGSKVEGRLDVPIQEGTKVGLRLDIPAYTNKNIWAITVHEDGRGKAMSYTNVARINNVEFISSPKVALGIARGKLSKSTIARMLGNWSPIEGANAKDRGENAKQIVVDVMNDPSWSQIGMNPFRHSYFYDRVDGMPVVSAEQVVQIGGLVYAKNAQKTTPFDERFEDKRTGLRFQAPTYDMEYTPNALVSLNLLSDNNRQPEQWVKEIAKGVKGSSRDVDTMGLLEALKSYKEQNNVKSIDKATVENIIATNMAQIETVILSDATKSVVTYDDFDIQIDGDQLRVEFPDGLGFEYSNVSIDSWESYQATDAEVIDDALNSYGYEGGLSRYVAEEAGPNAPRYPDNALDGGTNYREFLIRDASPEGIFFAPHYGSLGKNLIASARVDDRVGPNEEKILFVQEIQSDWVQGVNKDNFATKAELDKLKSDLNRINEIGNEIEVLISEMSDIQGTVPGGHKNIQLYEGSDGLIKAEYDDKTFARVNPETLKLDNTPSPREIEIRRNILNLFKESRSIESGGASAIERRISELRPYLPWNQTDLWTGLTIRKLINQASKEGYDQIAFINGKQSDRVQGHTDGRTAEFYDKIVPKNINKELDRLVKGSRFEVGTLENEGSLYSFRDFEFAMDERSDEFFDKIYTLETSMDRGDQVSLTISYEEEPVNPKTDVIKSYTLSYKDFTRTYQVPYGLKIYDEAVVDIRQKIMQDLSRLTSTKSENAVINLTPELKAATDKVGPLRFQVPSEGQETIYTSGLASIISDVSYALNYANYATGKFLTRIPLVSERPYDIRFTDLMKKPFGTHSDAEIKEIMMRSTGTVNEQLVVADNLVKRLLKANQESKIPMKEIDNLLHDKKKIEALPQGQLRDALIDMRMHIDALSRTLVREGYITGKAAFGITANEGLYIHRSYKTFEAKNLITGSRFVQKDQDIIDRATQFILKEQVEKDKRYDNDTDIEKLEAAKEIVKQLQDPKVRDRAMSADTGDNPTIVTSIFKQRNENIPQELKDLWGEVDDPIFNYKETVVNQAKSIAAYRMFEELNNLGKDKFISDKIVGGIGNKIVGEKYGALNGKYADNEMYSVITSANRMISESWFPRMYMNGVALFKKFLTVWNPSTHVINLAGNSYFGFINGHIGLNPLDTKVKVALKTAAQAVKGFSDMELQGLYQELTKLGVVSSSASLQEIRRISEDLGMYDYNVNEYMERGFIKELLKDPGLTTFKTIKKADRLVQKVYQAEDDVWKIFGFQVEKARYLEAGLSEAEATRLAAKNTIAVYPNYNEIPAALRFISRSPLVGTFVSFQAEAIRCSKNAVKLGFQEMQSENPEIKKIGIKRLASTIASFTVMQTAQIAIGNAILNGIGIGSSADDDDYKEKKQFALFAPWDRFGNILEIGNYVDEEGKTHVQYINMSRFSGGGFIKDLLRMAMSDDPVVSERRGLMMYKQMFDTFLGTEITLDIVLDVMQNRGNKVYNPDSTEEDQVASTLKYITDRLGPGVYRNMRRITESFDEASKYSTSREIGAMFGARVTDVVVDESLYYNSSAMYRSVKNIAKGGKVFGEEPFDLRNPIEFLQRLDDDSEVYNKDLDYLIDQMAQQWAAAQLHGVSVKAVIIPTLNRIGIPKHVMTEIYRKVRDNYVEEIRDVDSRDQTFMEAMGLSSNEEDVNKILEVTD